MTRNNSPSDAAATPEPELSKPAEANLLEWLEGFAERLKGRTNSVAEEVQQIVEEMDAVELNLENTFTSFRCLSSSQFVENHVYEEDETDLVSTRISKKDAKQPSVPTESYEHEILPRYKDAVAFAWAAFQGSSSHQSSVKSGSRSKLRDLRQDGMIQILPHVIGSEEFTRDVHCGLADLRHWHHDPESDTDVEQDTADLAAKPIDTGILSEGEISGTESDGFDSQEGVEPAVSAALDFKAMLEAALRNPYDGGTSNDALFGEFADNKFSLPNVTNDNMNNSPRTMSTMDESKDELRDSTSQQLIAHDNITQVPLATEPPEVLDDPIPSSTVEELLKKPLNSLTRAMLNHEFTQYIDSNNGNRQAGIGDLGHVPIIQGRFFNDEVRDTGFLSKDATVPNSNTGPTIPEGLFQEQLSSEPIWNTTSESQIFSSLDSSQILPRPLPSVVDIVPRSSSQDSDSMLINSDQNGSGKSQIAHSLITKHASLHSASSFISSGSNVILGSQQAGQLPFRGGLFDDDDEDEDAGDLFGAPAPRVDSQPVLRSWAGQNSKGLFDGIATEGDGTTSLSNEAGASPIVQQNSDISSLITSQYESQSGLGVFGSLSEPVVTASVEAYSESMHVDLSMSSDPIESISKNQSDIKEVMQLPIQFTEATAVRRFITESDDDSWSGSESGIDELIQGKNVLEQQIHQDAAMKASGNNDSGVNAYQIRTAEGIVGLMREGLVDSGHLAQSVSAKEKTLPLGTHGEGEHTFLSSQTAPEVPPSRFPPATSRSFSLGETSPEKVSVKRTENLLTQSKFPESSDTEASDSSDSASSSGDLQGVRPVQNIFSGTSNLSENLGTSTGQPPSIVNQTWPSSAENSGNNLTSKDWSKISSRNLPVRVNELGRSTRTFTPLFDDDDAEEDLSGRGSPQHQGVLFPRRGQLGIVLSSDTTLPSRPGRSRIGETESSLMTQNVHPQQPPASSSSSDIPFSSHSSSVEQRDDDLSSAKSGSKLSSLLFGDNDEDDEDALFGPLGGRTWRGLKSGKA